jgi:ribosomal protein S27E
MGTVSIGASVCIYGILGAYWFLYPRDRIVFPLIIIKKWPISLIVAVYIGITALFIIIDSDSNVSHIAHFAGFVGAFPIAALVRPKPVEEGPALKKAKVDDLRPLAKTKEQKKALERVLKADEPEVRDAWLEDLFRKVDCPKCGNRGMAYAKDRAECPRCRKVLRT